MWSTTRTSARLPSSGQSPLLVLYGDQHYRGTSLIRNRSPSLGPPKNPRSSPIRDQHWTLGIVLQSPLPVLYSDQYYHQCYHQRISARLPRSGQSPSPGLEPTRERRTPHRLAAISCLAFGLFRFRSSLPLPYSRTMPRPHMVVLWGGAVSDERGTPVPLLSETGTPRKF
jgi:hypothetical protein